MIALLGPPPPSLLARANLRSKFFSEEGKSNPFNPTGSCYRSRNANDAPSKGDFSAGIPVPPSRTLERRETSLQGEEDKEDRDCFLRFMRRMLQWVPENRSCARELAEDEWITKHTTES